MLYILAVSTEDGCQSPIFRLQFHWVPILTPLYFVFYLHTDRLSAVLWSRECSLFCTPHSHYLIAVFHVDWFLFLSGLDFVVIACSINWTVDAWLCLLDILCCLISFDWVAGHAHLLPHMFLLHCRYILLLFTRIKAFFEKVCMTKISSLRT